MALQRLKKQLRKQRKNYLLLNNKYQPAIHHSNSRRDQSTFDMNLTRAKFDELTHDLVERTAIPVQNA